MSYADDTTPYTNNRCLEMVLDNLQNDTNQLFEWFNDNNMKANEDKCHLLVSCKEEVSVNINGFSLCSSNE